MNRYRDRLRAGAVGIFESDVLGSKFSAVYFHYAAEKRSAHIFGAGAELNQSGGGIGTQQRHPRTVLWNGHAFVIVARLYFDYQALFHGIIRRMVYRHLDGLKVA
jgi:hypothetical protein